MSKRHTFIEKTETNLCKHCSHVGHDDDYYCNIG